MSHPGDNIVLYLLLLIIVFLLFRRWISFRTFMSWSKQAVVNNEIHAYVPRGEVPDLLRESGFEMISGKEKVELSIIVNEEEYESRYYIDYIVEREGSVYVVIVAKERKPIRMSGPSLRDAFLSQYLLFQPDGIIYVNREKGSIKLIEFDVPDYTPQTSDWKMPVSFFTFGLGIGVIATWLMLK